MPSDTSQEFWESIDILVRNSRAVIDRPKGTSHPRFPAMVYPVDYGYLENTTSPDGGGIDIYVGTGYSRTVDALICTVDLVKKDSEIKLLIGCTPEEQGVILDFHNNSEYMKAIVIERE